MAAVAIDKDAMQAHLDHLPEGNLHRPAVGVRWRVAFLTGHAAIETRRRRESNCRLVVAGNAAEPLRFAGVEKLVPSDLVAYEPF